MKQTPTGFSCFKMFILAGAFFLQKFVDDFRKKYDSKDDRSDDDKELENLLLLISAMYHFKVLILYKSEKYNEYLIKFILVISIGC
jgi:hypothetical protein